MINNSFFSTEILRWFRENGRDLPWRETRDPYAIWLSEIILQQTRIAQGWEYWERFVQTYPKVEDLAAASEDDVLKLWQGLGYYSRARNLHTAAKQIVALGAFPNTLEDIKSLKGVGDYTAAAIGSFAFDIPAAVVDGNVYRVLSRYFGIDTPINSTQGKKEFAALAQSLLPASDAASYNQGMMDFGAIQCTPQSPKCLLCPFAETCEALRCGRVEELPVKNKTVKVRNFDNTIVTISPITLVNGSFQNWIGMQKSGGRRVKRVVYFDFRSVRLVDEALKRNLLAKHFATEDSFKLKESLQKAIDKDMQEGKDIEDLKNPAALAPTNLQLYRKFMEKYLRQRPEVNTDLTLMVRHMEATQCGLPIEFYFFIKDKVWVNYEHILADIMEHAYALANEFGLKIYEQYPDQ